MKYLSQLTLWILPLIVSLSFILSEAAEEQLSTNVTRDPTSKTPIDDPDLTTFVELLKAADLFDLFSGTGPFTVFVPSNEAFKKLGTKKKEELLKPENKDRLADLIIYHFVPGKYLSKNLKSTSLSTVNGKKLEVINDNGVIKVNGAKVTRFDLVGPNGVVHVIDTVLVP